MNILVPTHLCAFCLRMREPGFLWVLAVKSPALKSHKRRAGEMAQWLRALAAVPEDPGSIFSNHMAVPVHKSCSKTSDTLTDTYMQAKLQYENEQRIPDIAQW